MGLGSGQAQVRLRARLRARIRLRVRVGRACPTLRRRRPHATYYLLLTTYYLPSVDVDHTRARRRLLLLPRELVQHLVGVRVRVRDGVRC